MKYDRTALFATGFAAVTLLSACGQQQQAGVAAPAPPPATSAPTSSPETSAADGGSADATPPGTKLKVGDRAVVPFKYGNKKGTIAITVTAMELGPNADLAPYGDKAKGMLPVYIRMSVENVGGTDLAFSAVNLRTVGANGRSTGVVVTGGTPKCKSQASKKDFTTVGAKYETCELQAIRETGELGGASYSDTDVYKDEPIIWKK